MNSNEFMFLSAFLANKIHNKLKDYDKADVLSQLITDILNEYEINYIVKEKDERVTFFTSPDGELIA